MTKEELYNLLDEMSLPGTIVSKLYAPQWHFWKKETHIKGNEVFPLLREFIELRAEKSDTEIRENAYSVLAKLLLDNIQIEYCQFLIDRLAVETNKYVLHTMLNDIRRLQLPEEINISPVIACSKSEQWLVRHNAIMALGISNTTESREAVRYWVRQTDHKKYRFELFYANSVLGNIGEPNDIALLEQHIHSRVKDVRGTAVYAIENIKKRFGMTEIEVGERSSPLL